MDDPILDILDYEYEPWMIPFDDIENSETPNSFLLAANEDLEAQLSLSSYEVVEETSDFDIFLFENNEVPRCSRKKQQKRKLSSRKKPMKKKINISKRVRPQRAAVDSSAISVGSSAISVGSSAVSVGSSAECRPEESDIQGEDISFAPSEKELEDCKTHRQREAVKTFYLRMNELKSFKNDNGDCNVPQQYHNKKLGSWVNKMRQEKRKMESGGHSTILDDTRIDRLNGLGFSWGEPKGMTIWEKHFNALCRFKEEHGHCNVPTRGSKKRTLGRFVSTQRHEYKEFLKANKSLMTLEKIERLESIGFRWEMRNTTLQTCDDDSSIFKPAVSLDH